MAACSLGYVLSKDPMLRYYNQLESDILKSGVSIFDDELEEVKAERAEYLQKKYGIVLKATLL